MGDFATMFFVKRYRHSPRTRKSVAEFPVGPPSTGPDGGRGGIPANNFLMDFGPNGSKSSENGRILITK